MNNGRGFVKTNLQFLKTNRSQMKTVTIEGHLRTEAGKKAARQLRSQENVLGVIYGGATEVNFYASAKAFKPLVYTSEFQLAEVTVEGKTYKCILKDLQFDKVSDALIHVDLLELVDNKKVIATLPLKLVGAAAGIKAGGKLVVKLKSLKVKAFPKDLREFIELDITKLELNENIRVQDVQVPNIELIKSLVGWEPKRDLSTMISDIADFLKK